MAALVMSVVSNTFALPNEVSVPLQPFTMDEPAPPHALPARSSSSSRSGIVRAELVRSNEILPARRGPIHLAYYTPRSAQPVAPQDDESIPDYAPEPQADGIEIGGSHPTVPGNRAVLRNGIAYAPSNAPQSVKQAIWAVNTLRNRPYIWGGGHGSFQDYGYDCSGTVSFALHYAGALDRPLPSSDLLRYGEYGRGRWITVYSRNGHTFAIIAGLRLDTTDFRHGGNDGPRWHTDGRDTWGFQVRHPAGL